MPPLCVKWQHDCQHCHYLGSLPILAMDGESRQHVDFYHCDGLDSYVGRFGEGGDYVSMLGCALDGMEEPTGDRTLLVLWRIRMFDRSQHKSDLGFSVSFGRGILGRDVLVVGIYPLLEERRQCYVLDAFDVVSDEFRGMLADNETLCCALARIACLVNEQIAMGR